MAWDIVKGLVATTITLAFEGNRADIISMRDRSGPIPASMMIKGETIDGGFKGDTIDRKEGVTMGCLFPKFKLEA